MLNTAIFFKDAGDSTVQVPIELTAGEVVQNIQRGSVTPLSTSTLQASVISGLSTPIQITLKGGDPEISYGFPLTITTDQRIFVVTVAVSVGASEFKPYLTTDPTSFADMLGSIDAGEAALGTVAFQFPVDLDPSGGFVTWELLDEQGVVYSSGNAFEYKITSTGLANVVMARSVLAVPSSTPPSIDHPYTLRYTLTLPDNATQQNFYSYEAVTVTGLALVPLGTSNSIEMQGDEAVVSLVTDRLYDSVEVEIQFDNKSLGMAEITKSDRVSSGYLYSAAFDTTGLPVSLEPYRIVWKYKQSIQRSAFRESASLWVVNSSLLGAVDDVRAKINKARQTLYGTDDTQYSNDTIMTWLRRGRDAFNSSYGVFTSFTMTNAKGGIRDYWLMYAEMMALESAYLMEGEKAFQFQGANISLDVDRTSFLDSAAAKIQQRLDNEVKNAKQVMIMRGASSGDGSVDPQRLQKGAIGSVGISISPASGYANYLPYTRIR